jgi:hypothetical protein
VLLKKTSILKTGKKMINKILTHKPVNSQPSARRRSVWGDHVFMERE